MSRENLKNKNAVNHVHGISMILNRYPLLLALSTHSRKVLPALK